MALDFSGAIAGHPASRPPGYRLDGARPRATHRALNATPKRLASSRPPPSKLRQVVHSSTLGPVAPPVPGAEARRIMTTSLARWSTSQRDAAPRAGRRPSTPCENHHEGRPRRSDITGRAHPASAPHRWRRAAAGMRRPEGGPRSRLSCFPVGGQSDVPRERDEGREEREVERNALFEDHDCGAHEAAETFDLPKRLESRRDHRFIRRPVARHRRRREGLRAPTVGSRGSPDPGRCRGLEGNIYNVVSLSTAAYVWARRPGRDVGRRGCRGARAPRHPRR